MVYDEYEKCAQSRIPRAESSTYTKFGKSFLSVNKEIVGGASLSKRTEYFSIYPLNYTIMQ